MFGTHINGLVNKQSWEVVLGTVQIQVAEVFEDVDGALFFIYGNRVGNPSGIGNGVNESCCAQLLNFVFDCNSFDTMDEPFLLVDGHHIR